MGIKSMFDECFIKVHYGTIKRFTI